MDRAAAHRGPLQARTGVASEIRNPFKASLLRQTSYLADRASGSSVEARRASRLTPHRWLRQTHKGRPRGQGHSLFQLTMSLRTLTRSAGFEVALT
jgi:hypothetical protein